MSNPRIIVTIHDTKTNKMVSYGHDDIDQLIKKTDTYEERLRALKEAVCPLCDKPFTANCNQGNCDV